MKQGIFAISKGLAIGLGLTVILLTWATIGTEAAQWRYRDEPMACFVGVTIVVVPVLLAALCLTANLASRR